MTMPKAKAMKIDHKKKTITITRTAQSTILSCVDEVKNHKG